MQYSFGGCQPNKPPPELTMQYSCEGCQPSKGAYLVQCAHSVTIWAFGRPRDPYFVILGASLLSESRF